MTPRLKGRLAAVAAIGSLVAAAVIVYGVYKQSEVPTTEEPIETAEPHCLAPKPTLAVLAGDGEVTLTWSFPVEPALAVQEWQYQESSQGSVVGIGSAATSHTVRNLTNGDTYTFRVRAVAESGAEGCWSDPVAAAPVDLGGVLERIEKHQEVMAREGVRALAEVAKSTDEIAEELADIAELLNKDCTACPQPPADPVCDAEPLGTLLFEHDAHRVHDPFGATGATIDNARTIQEIVAKLRRTDGGVVLTEGYATATGFARHNLHLSDLRAICASVCLREELQDEQDERRFEFREIAKGEVLVASDLSGQSGENRRVDVRFCAAPLLRDPSPEAERRFGLECGCPRWLD